MDTRRFFDAKVMAGLTAAAVMAAAGSCLVMAEENAGYIYEDDIRGLNDFARFLRKFGSSVYVREPEELRKTMVFSLNRTLEKYREEGLYE